MNKISVPFQRKSLYLLLTIPMIGMYIGIAVLLWKVSVAFLIVYCALFVFVPIAQSYVCVYFQCPYIGKFAPCVGGFCLPSSQIARWFKSAKRSEWRYNIIVTLAFAAFLGIIALPLYFLFHQSVVLLLIYCVIVAFYGASFLGFICPVCGTRYVCPGGQTSTKLMEIIKGYTT
jgi:hypothetical protein